MLTVVNGMVLAINWHKLKNNKPALLPHFVSIVDPIWQATTKRTCPVPKQADEYPYSTNHKPPTWLSIAFCGRPVPSFTTNKSARTNSICREGVAGAAMGMLSVGRWWLLLSGKIRCTFRSRASVWAYFLFCYAVPVAKEWHSFTSAGVVS